MSLLLVTRFAEGVLLASDPFVFDNCGAQPRRRAEFQRFHHSPRLGVALAGVGSRWVFRRLCERLEELAVEPDGLISRVSQAWRVLNDEWKRARAAESAAGPPLRDISDSLLVLVRRAALDEIVVCEPDGTLRRSASFVLSGSGAELVRAWLESNGERFGADEPLTCTLARVQQCFAIARHDLYVLGYPALLVATSRGISDLSRACAESLRRSDHAYFTAIAGHAQAALTSGNPAR